MLKFIILSLDLIYSRQNDDSIRWSKEEKPSVIV